MKISVFEWETVCSNGVSPKKLPTMGDVSFYGVPAADDIVKLIGDSEAVICSKIPFTRQVMEDCPNLRYIGLMATGYNNIDLDSAADLGITVTNVPDYSADAVCQMTMAFLLQFATNLIRYTASTQNGDWTRSKYFCYYPYPMTELSGKTLGLFGLGSIGSKVAAAAAALGMRVIYHTRTPKDVPYSYVSAEELFAQSDFISLHLPLSAGTKELIRAETIAMMKPTAFLINTARGGLIREQDLADALRDHRIAGYAADVLTVEPQKSDCPLTGCPNCILTPHVAWAPLETRTRLWDILESNLECWITGNPQNVVNQ